LREFLVEHEGYPSCAEGEHAEDSLDPNPELARKTQHCRRESDCQQEDIEISPIKLQSHPYAATQFTLTALPLCWAKSSVK
jgi:hypothetical protein